MLDHSFKVLSVVLVAGYLAGRFPVAYALDPANYNAGGLFLTPTLDVRLGYVDNLFRSDRQQKETGVSEVRPRVQAWLENGPSTYSLTYELADYRYFDSSDDDFTDHTFNLDVYQAFNARNKANLFAEHYNGHEERGTGLTEGIARLIDEPLTLDRILFGGDYTYGSESSRGRLNFAARGLDHEYQNFRDQTRYRDRDQYQYDATFYWKIFAKTDALLLARYIDTEYDRTDPSDIEGSLDSEEIVYFVGLAWQATAKTTGNLKVGLYDRQYDSSGRVDDDGFSWEVDVTYKPKTYSRFNLESKRYFQETNGPGDAVDTKMTTLNWDHDWNTQSATRMTLLFGSEDYTSSRRKDDRYGIEASYSYAMRRWVDLSVSYRYEDRDSKINFYDYSRNAVFVETKLSL